MIDSTPEDLVELYRLMAAHTQPECATTCRVPFMCCEPMYCAEADSVADSRGVELKKTDHPRLPFMGPDGCIVAPHLRPICTMHTCQINSIGVKPGDPTWTERYFELRDMIEAAEHRESSKKRRAPNA